MNPVPEPARGLRLVDLPPPPPPVAKTASAPNASPRRTTPGAPRHRLRDVATPVIAMESNPESAFAVAVPLPEIDAGPPPMVADVPEEAVALARAVAALPRLCLRGVMSIPDALPAGPQQDAVMHRVRAVFDAVRSALVEEGRGAVDTLSLGMTADLEAAVRAGSTLVRVGSGIFGERHYPSA